MAMVQESDETPEVLDQVARGLGDAEDFSPAVEVDDDSLPGRRNARGDVATPPTPIDDGGILDCGTSRRSGFTHVLWVDRGAAPEDLSHAVDMLPLVARVEWEGTELLHIEAPGASHADLLAEARRLSRR
ncbi:hypothetical protein [Demequina flava]|uniref:hypothetical protein n=1 Tax=Demequina flava TaxID=1095025 RepID=UPI0007843057|nr:hypothetical protein [Demequina flava]